MEWYIIVVSAALVLGLAYFSTGKVIYRLQTNGDISQVGSGGAGATNIARQLGVKYFFWVWSIDAGKAGGVIFFLNAVFSSSYLVVIAGGLVMFVFNIFRGGKGVSTAFGIILAFTILGYMPIAQLLIILICFLFTLVASDFMSAGSLAAAGALLFTSYLFGTSMQSVWTEKQFFLDGLYVVLAGGIFLRHLKNINRLRNGQEEKAGLKKRLFKVF